MNTLSKILTKAIRLTSTFGKSEIPQSPALDFDLREPKNGGFYTAGFGKCEIHPPKNIHKKKYYIAGYNENNPATGLLDVQTAHALWLDDNSGRGGILMISVDCVGLLNADVNNIRFALRDFSKRTGCRSINICSTHDHAGIDTMGIWGPLPKTGLDIEFMQTLYKAVIKASETAFANRKNADIFYGKAEVPDMQEDIRLPIVYSRTLHRFRIVPRDGSREIWMLNFASHSESLSGENSLISADFPCYLRREISEKANADTIYFVGAIGGMISMEVHGKNMGEKIRDTQALGVKLASYAMSISNDEKIPTGVNVRRKEIFFDCENTVLMLAGLASILDVNKIKAENTTLGYAVKSELSLITLGDKNLLLLPCELFPELAYGGYLDSENSAEGLPPEVNPQPLCSIIGDENTIIFGLANDEVGYVIPPNDFMLNEDTPYLDRAFDRFGRKHYEETNSLGRNTAWKIAQELGWMMD